MSFVLKGIAILIFLAALLVGGFWGAMRTLAVMGVIAFIVMA